MSLTKVGDKAKLQVQKITKIATTGKQAVSELAEDGGILDNIMGLAGFKKAKNPIDPQN